MYNFIIKSIFGSKETNSFPTPKAKLVSVDYESYEKFLTLKYSNGEEDIYHGRDVTWVNYPMMSDPGSSRCLKLYEYYQYCIHHKGPWPDSHLKGGK